ncbi:hypothetical protein [Fibrobacter sp. UBA4297]|uniref:hypothetical protein n=1 Tax=Fibrobacter sp. UBA4297 TaxID=1946536 RepID=UPI0025C127CA|nr:hypothetical protein [Fibrobacter sp. UBA4297]
MEFDFTMVMAKSFSVSTSILHVASFGFCLVLAGISNDELDRGVMELEESTVELDEGVLYLSIKIPHPAQPEMFHLKSKL